MSEPLILLSLGASIVVLLLSGMPVAFALGILSFVGYYALNGMQGIHMAETKPWSEGYNFTVMAIPLFIMMGHLMQKSGVFEDLFRMFRVWLGRLPGALGIVTTLLSGAFSAVSGSGAAATATMTTICYPHLEKNGYNKPFAAGLLVSGGSLGPLIPPSGFMILYGVLAEQSVAQLFAASILPGILLIALICIYVFLRVTIDPSLAAKLPGATWGERFSSLKSVVPFSVLVFGVLGSIYLGWATPTEAAAVGVVCSVLLSASLGRLKFEHLFEAMKESTLASAFILIIIIFAGTFGSLLTFIGIPQYILNVFSDLDLSIGHFLLLLMVMYLIMGMFLDGISIAVLTVPLLAPVLEGMGVNLVWFGVILVILIEIGTMTPPFALHVFIVQGLTKIPYRDVVLGSLPMMLLWMLTALLVAVFPGLALWLVTGP